VQLPCPEQHAWGGVLKRSMLRLYGRPILRRRAVRRSFVAVARRVTEFEYARLARRAAAEIADYISCGFEVVDVVGVGASPSCGVTTTVDLDGAIAAMAACDRDTLDPTMVNNLVGANVTAGEGLFIAALRHRLARRGIDVPFREHDLLAELRAVAIDYGAGGIGSFVAAPVTVRPWSGGPGAASTGRGGEVDARLTSR
jgi:hypothetical protein